MTDARCVFCDIVRGAESASVVYRGENCVAFLDIHPISRGHVLVVPTVHQARLNKLDVSVQQELFAVAGRVLAALQRAGYAADGANLLLNDGTAANQHVPHVHIHVVPRMRGDRIKTIWRFVTRMLNLFGRARGRQALDKLADEIRRNLR